jgi:hypothetical protein
MIAGVSARAGHSHIGSAIRGFYGPRLLRADALRHVLVAYAKSIAWRNMGTSDYSETAVTKRSVSPWNSNCLATKRSCIATAVGATIVTANTVEFKRIRGLKIEN